MTRIIPTSLVLCLAAAVPLHAKERVPFEELSMVLEVNATDGDAEVVIRAKTEEGLSRFFIRNPKGRKIADVRSCDGAERRKPIGLREILFETAEPALDILKAAYPEGTYKVEGRTVTGKRVYGEAVLSYAVLAAPTFTPEDGAEVSPTDLKVEWEAVAGAAFYLVEIENDDLDLNLTVKLPGTATSFNVPNGLLLPGTEYDLGVASVSEIGSVVFAEASFTTTEP